jgi:hypothetical protein
MPSNKLCAERAFDDDIIGNIVLQLLLHESLED